MILIENENLNKALIFTTDDQFCHAFKKQLFKTRPR